MPRGRPPGSKNKPKEGKPVARIGQKTLRNYEPKRICAKCQQSLAPRNFYRSQNPMHTDGYSPFCKDCFCSECLDNEGHVDYDKLKLMLQQVDRPFINRLVDAAVSEYQNKYVRTHPDEPNANDSPIVKIYMRMVSALPAYNRLTYANGVELDRIQRAGTDKLPPPSYWTPNTHSVRTQSYDEDDEPIYLEDEKPFEVTPEIVRRFGQGYTKKQYRAMQEKYDFLTVSYPDVTNLHTEALCTYIKLKVQEEQAVVEGDVEKAAEWSALASKAADKAKINPSQLSKTDMNNGVNSYSELMMALEQEVDIIPILPRFLYEPKDAPDFILWCYINYVRRAEGKPDCAYEDVYHFYEEHKQEYIRSTGDPYGLFKDDPTEENHESVKRFIALPKDYGESNG